MVFIGALMDLKIEADGENKPNNDRWGWVGECCDLFKLAVPPLWNDSQGNRWDSVDFLTCPLEMVSDSHISLLRWLSFAMNASRLTGDPKTFSKESRWWRMQAHLFRNLLERNKWPSHTSVLSVLQMVSWQTEFSSSLKMFKRCSQKRFCFIGTEAKLPSITRRWENSPGICRPAALTCSWGCVGSCCWRLMPGLLLLQ